MDPITRSRLNSGLLETLAALIERRVKDPRVEPVTLMGVEVAGDLSSAKVYYSVLGDEEEQRIAQRGLENVANFLRREVGKVIRMRHVPQLRFIFDASLERGQRIDEILREIRDERHDHSGPPDQQSKTTDDLSGSSDGKAGTAEGGEGA